MVFRKLTMHLSLLCYSVVNCSHLPHIAIKLNDFPVTKKITTFRCFPSSDVSFLHIRLLGPVLKIFTYLCYYIDYQNKV